MNKWLSSLILALSLVFPQIAAAAIVEVATHDCGNNVVGTSSTCTLSSVTAGNEIIVGGHTGSSTQQTIQDSSGDSYTLIPGGSTGMSIWIATNVKSGSHLLTTTCSATTAFCGFVAGEFSGLGTSPTADGNISVSAYGTATVIQSTLKTPTVATSELLFCLGMTDSVQTPSGLTNYGAGNATMAGFTNQAQTSSSGGETLVVGWGVSTSIATNGCQWTVTSSPTLGAIAGILPGSTASMQYQSFCPAGANGPCIYPPMPVANLQALPCPSGVACQGSVIDALNPPAYGQQPVAGGGASGYRAEVEFNQSLGQWLFW